MGVLGQNDSDPGAKRNKEVRQCFKCSFNLSFSENREGNEVQGEGCPNSGPLGREEVAVHSGPGARKRKLYQLPWDLAESGRTALHRPTRSPSPLTTRMGPRARTTAAADKREV